MIVNIVYQIVVITRVAPFMRVTCPHIFEIRLKSIEFNDKHKNLEILTIFYSHIIRIFHYFFLFSYYSHIYKFICSFHFVAKLRLKMYFLFNIYLN